MQASCKISIVLFTYSVLYQSERTMKKHLLQLVSLSVTLNLLLFPTIVQAQKTLFQEDFSSDLSQWQPIRDDGRYWSIQDGALEALIPFGSTASELLPLDQVWTPADSYLIDMEYTALQGADKNITFGVVDTNNWYELHFTTSGSQVVKVADGTVTWHESFAYTLPMAVKQHVSIIFIKGKIQVLINGYQVLDTTDPTYQRTEGKLSLKATTGAIFPTKVRIDNILVRRIQDTPRVEGTQLEVELLKQSDERWSQLVYDTATQWSAEAATIKDWGCNLLSQLMILRYHGITQLANGSELTPASLNDWLLQHDGFYNTPPSGNIRRQSISHLTTELHQVNNTPKLEFTYVGDNLIPTAIAEIEKGNPVILELDGHFVVANGFTDDKTDLFIKDPAYSTTKLSEHPLPLKSVRLFTPSFTDLSYISLSSSDDIDIEIMVDGSSLNTSSYTEETRIYSEDYERKTSSTYITELAKPSTGEYQLSINNSTAQKKELAVTTYDRNGLSNTFALVAKAGETNYILHYDKDAKSSIEAVKQQANSSAVYSALRKTVRVLAAANHIKQPHFEKALLQLTKSAEKLPTSQEKKVLKALKTVIASTPRVLLTKQAKALLLEYVGLLLIMTK